MLSGLGVCLYYIVTTYPYLTQVTGFAGPRWFGIEPIASGAFGVPAGFAVSIVASLCDRRPDARTLALVDHLRRP
jgi:cation/acetate symporter